MGIKKEREMEFQNQTTLADAFRVWRLEHGYSVLETERRTGIPRTSVDRIEAGGWPMERNLRRVAQAFNMTPGQVIDKFDK